MASFELLFTFVSCERIVRIVLRHRDVIHILASAVGQDNVLFGVFYSPMYIDFI